MWRYLINLFFPAKCIICESISVEENICTDCWSNLTFITKPYCYKCSNPFNFENDEKALCGYCIMNEPKYDQALSILKYDDYSKKLIHKFKYNDQLHILDYLSRLMLNLGHELIEKSDIIVPVAMHKQKLLKRGFNQSALLAAKIAQKTKLQYIPDLLIKQHNKASQAGLERKERLKNIQGNFQLNKDFDIKGKRIILIDDVITTGATVNECCKMLRKGKPAKIYVLTLAKRV